MVDEGITGAILSSYYSTRLLIIHMTMMMMMMMMMIRSGVEDSSVSIEEKYSLRAAGKILN